MLVFSGVNNTFRFKRLKQVPDTKINHMAYGETTIKSLNSPYLYFSRNFLSEDE